MLIPLLERKLDDLAFGSKTLIVHLAVFFRGPLPHLGSFASRHLLVNAVSVYGSIGLQDQRWTCGYVSSYLGTSHILLVQFRP